MRGLAKRIASATAISTALRARGCENTHYVNTSGLHDPDHYTTAWDIYLITRALMPYEKFMEICNSKSAEIAETDHNQRHVLHSTNRLISNWRELGYLYRDEQGGAGVDVDLLKGGGRYAQQGDEQAEDQKKSKKAAFFHGNVPRSMLQ